RYADDLLLVMHDSLRRSGARSSCAKPEPRNRRARFARDVPVSTESLRGCENATSARDEHAQRGPAASSTRAGKTVTPHSGVFGGDGLGPVLKLASRAGGRRSTNLESRDVLRRRSFAPLVRRSRSTRLMASC